MGPHYLMQFFAYEHLTQSAAITVSKEFFEMATYLNEVLPENQEKTTALRKLLEAKDCAVRATFMKN